MGNPTILTDRDGNSKLQIRLDSDSRLIFEPLALRDSVLTRLGRFACPPEDAQGVCRGTAVQIVNHDGHLLARCHGKQVWVNYEVLSELLSETIIVEDDAFERAVEAALADKVGGPSDNC